MKKVVDKHGISGVLINDFQLQTMICIFEQDEPSCLNWILVILMTEEQQKNSHVLDHITRALYLKNRLFRVTTVPVGS